MSKWTGGWLIVALIVAGTSTGFAHMKLSKTLPAADSTITSKPEKVQIWYTQTPDKAVSRLTLTGPSGAVSLGPVEVGADKSLSAAVQGATPDGAYKVSWQTAGDDGHVQKGEFAFTVRQAR
ncbi:MAG: copper resistance protein CopC [Vicinamibacterales bacterium]